MNPVGRAALAALFTAVAAGGSGLPLERPEAEVFLRTAEIVDREDLEIGVTRPERVTLETSELTAHAVWKIHDEFEPVKRFADGSWETSFVDSYENEVAAYELDKLIGLEMIPPTVERRIGRRRGSLQLWVEGTIMETERMRRKLRPEDIESWNEQMLKVRLFHNLTHNTDFNNTGNILSDPEGRIYLIDHSRAFRVHDKLLAPGDLTRFSRSVLEGLRGLDEEILEQKLGRWLSKRQIGGLLARRDLILELAEQEVADQGEERVLYP